MGDCHSRVVGTCRWGRLDRVGLNLVLGGVALSVTWPPPPSLRSDLGWKRGPALEKVGLLTLTLDWAGVGCQGNRPSVDGPPTAGSCVVPLLGGGPAFGLGSCASVAEGGVGDVGYEYMDLNRGKNT